VDPLEKAVELRRTGVPHVLVTVAATRGSAPQDAGAKMVVTPDGLAAGTVGGGKVEAAAIRHATAMLSDRTTSPELVTWNLRRDVGMTCGGEMQLLFDPFPGTAWTIAVFGAGHISQALIPVLAPLACRLLCVDPRADWLSRIPAFPNLRTILTDSPVDTLTELPPDSFVLLMTQGHATDVPILREALLRHSFPFVGVIGSASKRAILERELRESDVPPDRIASFQCPLGLPIGTNHPQEIAISIAAGVLKARDELRNPPAMGPNP
jgi:xanthine dehydrogenase accessory protein XdhC